MDSMDRLSPDGGTSIRKIVPIDGSDHHVLEGYLGKQFSHSTRLFKIGN